MVSSIETAARLVELSKHAGDLANRIDLLQVCTDCLVEDRLLDLVCEALLALSEEARDTTALLLLADVVEARWGSSALAAEIREGLGVARVAPQPAAPMPKVLRRRIDALLRPGLRTGLSSQRELSRRTRRKQTKIRK